MDEDLEYYHLKELHCSAQCHTQMSLWIISRGVVLLILLMEYKGCWFGGKLIQKLRQKVWGKPDSETVAKKDPVKKLFKTACLGWGEVNPTHAYYNGSRTSKDNEDPGWNTSFKTRRTQKTTSAVEALWKTILRCYLYLLGTL
ncbi:hypothetical protein Tco_1418958 [Tanacetum coccineum]